jgi:hypothetical protein
VCIALSLEVTEQILLFFINQIMKDSWLSNIVLDADVYI